MANRFNEPVTDLDFSYYISQHEERDEDFSFSYEPLISVVVPVYNTGDDILSDCIDSVLSQSYKNFELILVDDCSTDDNVRPFLKETENKDKRVKVVFRKENGGISRATNDGINLSSGEFIAFMDCDDVITKNALYEFVKALNENKETDFLYSDEDKLSESGKTRLEPSFKPDWSPDLFMDIMYTNHLAMYRARIVKEIGGLRPEFDGAQDYDMTLRFMEKSDNSRVRHIDKILYHWRMAKGSTAAAPGAKPYIFKSQERLKEDALKRRGLKGHTKFLQDVYQYRVLYDMDEGDEKNKKVSIIIPSKDNPDVLKNCLKTLYEKNKYKNFEVILVDNGSSIENKEKVKNLILDYENIKYIYEKRDFNFSYMCNRGAKEASGDYLLFLNDDTEVLTPDFLYRMIPQSDLPHVGSVGAKLLYPDKKHIQHAGVLNLSGGPGHALIGWDDNDIANLSRNRLSTDYTALTGACLLIRRDKFNEVCGFDEKFPVVYNDIDLCFKLREKGYYNVLRNDAVLIHHESISRGGREITPGKFKREKDERERLYKKYPLFRNNDPFFNDNFLPNYPNYPDFRIKYLFDDINKNGSYVMIDDEIRNKYIYSKIYIDSVGAKRQVIVTGWHTTSDIRWDEEAKVTCFIELRPGAFVFSKTIRMRRPDVNAAGFTSADKPGFTAVFDQRYFDGSRSDFVIGLMYERDSEKRYYRTDRSERIDFSDMERPFFLLSEDEENEVLAAEKTGMDFFIEDFDISFDDYDDSTLKISGWAILSGEDDNYLLNKSLILKEKDGRYFRANLKTVLRHDHIENAPGRLGLLRAGFFGDLKLICGETDQEKIRADGEFFICLDDLINDKKYIRPISDKFKINTWKDALPKIREDEVYKEGSISFLIIDEYISSKKTEFFYDDTRLSIERQLEKNDEEKIRFFDPYRLLAGDFIEETKLNEIKSDLIIFMRGGSVLLNGAINRISELSKDHDLIYSDIGFLSDMGEISDEKIYLPDFSYDTLISTGYLTQSFVAIKRELLLRLDLSDLSHDGGDAFFYDLILRLLPVVKREKAYHIDDVLILKRKEKPDMEKRRAVLLRFLEKTGKKADVKIDDGGDYLLPIYDISDNKKVSIIIPSKDNFKYLKQCIETLKDNTEYKNYEIIIVDNGSCDAAKKEIEDYISLYGDIKYIYSPMEFNFSRMINIGADNSSGEYILLLNDDIEIRDKDFLSVMLGQAKNDHAGAVGAKLYYPGTTLIQHTGIINILSGPSHAFLREKDEKDLYFGRNRAVYNYSAVTGACLLISKEKFYLAGKMNESLPVSYNDTDLCFKLYEMGYYNALRADVTLYHHESISRKSDYLYKEKMIKLLKDGRYLFKNHEAILKRDPCYNNNLSGDSLDFKENGFKRKKDDILFEEINDIGHFEKINAYIEEIKTDDDVIITGKRRVKRNDDLERLYMILQENTGSENERTLKIWTEYFHLEGEDEDRDEYELGFILANDPSLFKDDMRIGFLTVIDGKTVYDFGTEKKGRE